MRFNSHVDRLLVACVRLVNSCSPGFDGTREHVVPSGVELIDAVAAAVQAPGYNGRPQRRQAEALAEFVPMVRDVFVAVDSGDLRAAAREVNRLLHDTGAHPHVEEDDSGALRVHFHGPDTTFARGWAAGLASGLAMALGGDLVYRLGVCQAAPCDRVYVDASKNSHKRFCSARCQSRVKAAAHRARTR